MQPLQFLLYWFTKVQEITLGSRMTEIYKATDGHLWFKKKKTHQNIHPKQTTSSVKKKKRSLSNRYCRSAIENLRNPNLKISFSSSNTLCKKCVKSKFIHTTNVF